MSYTITLTDGNVFATIADGTINTTSSMILVGKNYAGYGQFLDTNFIHLLENGSNTTAPAAPLTGQLWWDKGAGLLKVYTGTTFKTISAATASASEPTGAVIGDLWFDTTNQQLKAWTGASWLVIGPNYTSTQGQTGAFAETILDSGSNPQTVTSLYVNNTRMGIVAQSQFTPQVALQSAFPTVFAGITLTSAVPTAIFGGTANNSNFVNSIASTQLMRSDINTSTAGVLRVLNNTGLFVGTANAVNISQSGSDAKISSTISGQNVVIEANVGGTPTVIATASGSNGTFVINSAAAVGTTLVATGNITGGNLRTGGQVSATGNITGGNVISATILATTLSAVGNVQGNVVVANSVAVSSTVTAAGNITGNFFIGNGSQLTGITVATSAQRIVSGTTEANIGTPNGNININVDGVSNVAVWNTSGQVLNGTLTVNQVGNAVAIINGAGNAVGNIGSSSSYFNRVFATSTTALYADVAERFAADEVMEPGTVVELGGSKEITRSQEPLSDKVFGVISSRAAFLMNGGAGEDTTHPPVAMTGRVPVKVMGTIKKGDRLVSAGNGTARSAMAGEATPFNVIGRALQDHADTGEVYEVEAIVTIK
jgi:hypothetical protein